MEKFNLTRRVCNLREGEIFWFSGGWRYVIMLDPSYVCYKSWNPMTHELGSTIETLMRGSQMLIKIYDGKR